MKKFFLLLFLSAPFSAQSQQQEFSPPEPQATATISDSIDILHYTIKLDITDFTTDTIRGVTTIQLVPLVNNITEVPLDLLHMVVDSVVVQNNLLTYAYDDTMLLVNLSAAINIGDTTRLAVWYHGRPQLDPSGWGGFYFQSGYAFNLGVGFETDPHTFGRAWFPCFDNFVERSSYTFVIGANAGKVAYCNGLLTTDTTDANNIRWRTWELQETIPTYLASVNVAAYTQVTWTHSGTSGSYPVILTALPADTTNLKNSFTNLDTCLHAFEARYGPYRWSRAGYSLVPFNSGAMEHATNIAYPRFAANGSLAYESTLMAHELSHHWWGDLVTCRTPEDMWLNEGWATYSQYIFTEWLYGLQNYKTGIRTNHDDVIHFAHLREGGYRAVSGVPHAYTYGVHVYNKGADVAHTLRGYMGDSLFWAGLQYHMNISQFSDVSSADFRDNLIVATGLTYLNDFFNDWVFNPGFPHFSIDSVVSVPNGPDYDVTVYVEQKLRGAPNFYTNVPLEFSFFENDMSRTTQRVLVSGQYFNFTTTLPFDPVMTAIDVDGKISDAITDEERTITAAGTQNYTAARCTVTVMTVPDTTYMRIEHNWAAPDAIQNNPSNYRISSLRYWTIDGIIPAGFYAKARFYYDGRTGSTAGPGQWLDNDLTIVNGDSIILLYRRDASEEWQEWPYYSKTVIGPVATSKYGYAEIDSLAKGEYAFACGVSTVLIGVDEEAAPNGEVIAYPNPACDQLTVEWPVGDEPVEIRIYDTEGRLVHAERAGGSLIKLVTDRWSGGIYNVEVIREGQLLGRNKVLIYRH